MKWTSPSKGTYTATSASGGRYVVFRDGWQVSKPWSINVKMGAKEIELCTLFRTMKGAKAFCDAAAEMAVKEGIHGVCPKCGGAQYEAVGCTNDECPLFGTFE